MQRAPDMRDGGWRRSLLRAGVGFSALLLAACEHGPPAVEHGTVLAASPAHQAAENAGTGAVAGAVIGGTVGGLSADAARGRCWARRSASRRAAWPAERSKVPRSRRTACLTRFGLTMGAW